MGSSLPFSPPCLLPNKTLHYARSIDHWNPFTASRSVRQRRYCSVIFSTEGKPEASWINIEENSLDGYGGWSVRKPEIEDRNVIPKYILAGVGTSMAVLIAAFSYISFSRRGFKFQFDAPYQNFHELFMPSESKKAQATESTMPEVNQASETKMEDKPDISHDPLEPTVNRVPAGGENKRIVVPVAADPTQQESLCVLKKLRIIENDVSGDELCTRREFARWFVKANSMLERNPKHRVVPRIVIAGSLITAFDDVSVNDPDFWYIQVLGETGIVLSKLSTVDSYSPLEMSNLDTHGDFCFSPESFLSRFDLVNWKAMLEYPFTSEMKEKMLRKRVGFLDLSASSLDASPQLSVDLMAGDRSITRRVFGNIRRLQAHKPVSKAQAAVTLTSGRMAGQIRSELSRIEAENQSRLAEIEEIRSELIRRGEIQRFWEDKLNKERERGFEVERDFQAALLDLEKEKVSQAESFAEYLKERAALDCQQQLLFNLRKEVDGMCDRLAWEKANFLAEQQSLEKHFADLHDQQNAMIEAKSILEAEKEALRILRCWVEEEARRTQARVKTLEQAAQRWKGIGGLSQASSSQSEELQSTARN